MTHSYAPSRRPPSWFEKLLRVNWGLVLLIAVIASIGCAMQYSMAGGHFYPWAAPQMERFGIGLLILMGVSLVDIRIWMTLAYPAYAISFLLLIAVEMIVGRHTWPPLRAFYGVGFGMIVAGAVDGLLQFLFRRR